METIASSCTLKSFGSLKRILKSVGSVAFTLDKGTCLAGDNYRFEQIEPTKAAPPIGVNGGLTNLVSS